MENMEAMTVEQLEAEVNHRYFEMVRLRSEMKEIQAIIAKKNALWMNVDRFAGWSDEKIAEFHKLHQGVAV